MNTINVYSNNILEFEGNLYPCALGKSGVMIDKKEGDNATPEGCFQLREVFYRPDRLSKPISELPIKELSQNDGWCDDVNDLNYNKFVKLPYNQSHEELWRDDHVYDIIVPLGYNDDPPIARKGSAIFMHVARENYSPTAGCVALSEKDLSNILRKVTKDTQICIHNTNWRL